MVPGVPFTVVGWVVGVAVLLFLANEGPFLVELDLTRVRGKKRPVRHEGRGRAPRRFGSGDRPCHDRPCKVVRSVGRHTLRRCGPRPIEKSPAEAGS